MHKNRGVEFVLKRKVVSYESKDHEVNMVNTISKRIPTDYVVHFPNNYEANTDMFNQSSYDQEINFDRRGRLLLEIDMNSGQNRIFGAGGCAATQSFLNNERLPVPSHGDNVTQGTFVAYNIIGLGIPYMIVPFNSYSFYGHVWRETGSMNYFEQCVVDGNPKSNEFIAYYANNSIGVNKAAGFTSKANKMSVLREALRTNQSISPNSDHPGVFTKVNVEDLEHQVRLWNKSACYKQVLFKLRFEPVTQLILWDEHKLRMGDAYYNFWEHGRLTEGELLRRQEQSYQNKIQDTLKPINKSS